MKCNLTGCDEGTDDDRKMSLLKLYKDKVIPAIEKKIVKKINEDGNRRQIMIVKQEDNAGPHVNTKYMSEMEAIFSERNWVVFNQPPQSPVTNVHDACIFSMMTRYVSRQQAVNYSNRQFQLEEINKVVMEVFFDKKNLVSMSRAFAGHHQLNLLSHVESLSSFFDLAIQAAIDSVKVHEEVTN